MQKKNLFAGKLCDRLAVLTDPLLCVVALGRKIAVNI